MINECDPSDQVVQAEEPVSETSPAERAHPLSLGTEEIRARHWMVLAIQEASYSLMYPPGSVEARRCFHKFIENAKKANAQGRKAGW